MNTMQNPRMQAQALKRMGRGPDTQLIHMTDSEIDALNGLSALVFKEPLRTNPQTGLPEAGLFKRLLPTVLAIGAATFLGPSAAMAFAPAGATSAGALATGLGTGLTAFGGHLAGQALAGEGIDFGRAALAGAGSGLLSGFGAASDISTAKDAIEAAKAADFAPDALTNLTTDQALQKAIADPSKFALGADGTEAVKSLALGSQASGLGGAVRTFEEAGKFLGDDLLMNVGAPLGVAALTGEFDEPLPEAPEEPEREPFVPTPLRATRKRRDLDRDEDGEVTQEDILELVQALPEGQSSRFYTPMQYTPLSTGGLVNLEQGGSVKAAIQSLTGGEGSAILPMIAQAVIKPEEEEEQATTKGYPLGTPGTPPGMPTTGIPIGGGQPPQPFQTGGQTALDVATDIVDQQVQEFEDDPLGKSIQTGVNLAAGPFGIPGTVEAVTPKGSTINSLASVLNPGRMVSNILGIGKSLFTPPPPAPPPPPPPSAPPAGETADPDAAAAEAAAAAMASMGMDLGDQPEDFEDGNPAVPGGLPSLAETAANVVSSAPGIGGPTSGASSTAPADAPQGSDELDATDSDTGNGGGSSGADAADAAGPGGDGSDSSAADDVKTGGQIGIGMQRLLKFEQGGLAGIPYFEGRVMPTGDPKEDGMSDNIPFVIAGQEGGQMGMQPAILSPDEYVIPADVVSMLGNGSSTAGSNQLDQFISNFRMDKYGRPKQPPEMRGGLSSLA